MKLLSLSSFIAVACLACDPPSSRADAGSSSTADGGQSTNEPDGGPSTYPQLPGASFDTLVQALPKNAAGEPVLLTVDGDALTVGPRRIDAVGAAASCRDLKSSCHDVSGDADACVATVPRCTSSTPWTEAAPCCPSACVDAYQQQRRLGATPIEANRAVFGSTHECFPGLQAQYRAAGGTPYLAPRKTP